MIIIMIIQDSMQILREAVRGNRTAEGICRTRKKASYLQEEIVEGDRYKKVQAPPDTAESKR